MQRVLGPTAAVATLHAPAAVTVPCARRSGGTLFPLL